MTIRSLGFQDIIDHAESIREFLAICFRVTFGTVDENVLVLKTNSLIEHLKLRKAFAFGAFMNDKMVGFLWGYPVDGVFEKVFHVAYIAVKESGRRQGIGQSLLREAENKAKELGLRHIELIVGANNSHAGEFYSKLGYRIDRYILDKRVLEESD